MIRVEVIQAWPRRHESRRLDLPEGATAVEALEACGIAGAAFAIFGERSEPTRALADGDRIEVLRPLVADPKDSRRRRAARGAS